MKRRALLKRIEEEDKDLYPSQEQKREEIEEENNNNNNNNNIIEDVFGVSEDYLQELPLELIVEIMENLRPEELLKICSVSKFINEYVCNNNSLNIWSNIYRRDISEGLPFRRVETGRLSVLGKRTLRERMEMAKEENLKRVEFVPLNEREIREKYVDILREIKGLNIDSSLVYAVTRQYEKLVKLYLDLGANPNLTFNRSSLLEIATGNRNIEIMILLLDKMDLSTAEGIALLTTPLLTAVRMGFYDGVKLLINKGANIHYKNDMVIASAVNNLSAFKNTFPSSTKESVNKAIHDIGIVIDILLANGASKLVYGQALINNGVEYNDRGDIDKALSLDIPSLNQYYLNERFIQAVKDDDIDSTIVLLSDGADVHFKHSIAFLYAIKNNDKEMVNLLLANAVMFDRNDFITIFITALEEGNHNIIQSLYDLNLINEQTYLKLYLSNLITQYNKTYVYQARPSVREYNGENRSRLVNDIRDFLNAGIVPMSSQMRGVLRSDLGLVKLIVPYYLSLSPNRDGDLRRLINWALHLRSTHFSGRQKEEDKIIEYLESLKE